MITRALFPIALLFTMAVSCNNSQSSAENKGASQALDVNQISQYSSGILAKKKNLTVKEKTIIRNGLSYDTKGFFKENDLVLIESKAQSENNKIAKQYFVKEGLLVRTNTFDYVYNNNTLKSKSNNEYIFQNGDLAIWKVNGKTSNKHKNLYKSQGFKIQQEFTTLMSILNQ